MFSNVFENYSGGIVTVFEWQTEPWDRRAAGPRHRAGWPFSAVTVTGRTHRSTDSESGCGEVMSLCP